MKHELSPLPETRKWETIVRWLGRGSINVFGRPLAGKDTQAAAIAEQVHGKTLSGGQILRDAADPDVLRQIDTGLLLTQQQYLAIVIPYLGGPEYSTYPLVLSSVGRWNGEQHDIMKATAASGHPIRAVVSLELTNEQSRERLRFIQEQGHGTRGQRADDHHAALEIRLKEFTKKTEPVIDWYEQQKLLVRVDASQPADVVILEIRDKLFELALAAGTPSQS